MNNLFRHILGPFWPLGSVPFFKLDDTLSLCKKKKKIPTNDSGEKFQTNRQTDKRIHIK